MPIRISCSCGKPLQVPDAAAGKAVKCPSCSQTLRVPAPSGGGAPSAAAPPPRRPAASPKAAPVDPGLSDLFDEEGFSESAQAVCPACRLEMKPGSVLCTSCGYHVEQGVRYEAHKTAGVDIDMGTVALNRAEADMAKAARLQSDLVKGGGMPTWALALILTVLVGLALIGVIAINVARRAEQEGTANTFNALATFLGFTGICFNLVALLMQIRIFVHAYKNDLVKLLLTLFVPFYLFYYVFTNWRATGKSLVIMIVTSVIAGGCYAAAASRM